MNLKFSRVGAKPALVLSLMAAVLAACASHKSADPVAAKISKHLQTNPIPDWIAQTGFPDIAAHPEKYRLQIVYTQIDRDVAGRPIFTEHRYRTGAEYQYPASTVKFPMAVLALEHLNTQAPKAVTRDTPMHTAALFPDDSAVTADASNLDPATAGQPTLAHYIKKILLVSDNDAHNRLYEFVGHARTNARLREWGFQDARFWHRLERSLTPAQNAQTPAIVFRDAQGAPLWQQASQSAPAPVSNRVEPLGEAYMKNDQRIVAPMDFSLKNRWPIENMHTLLRWVMFPESQPADKRLALSADDYAFLQRYMRMMPGESNSPKYPAEEYWPTYVKFLYYGSEKNAALKPGLEIYNKVGDAYGFLLDSAYFKDAETGVEFLLSAGLYVNSDGVLNDSQYDYDTIGFPFLKALGRVVMAAEMVRRR